MIQNTPANLDRFRNGGLGYQDIVGDADSKSTTKTCMLVYKKEENSKLSWSYRESLRQIEDRKRE